MKGLYKKASINETWGRVEGLHEALTVVYNIFNKTKKNNLVYPIIDLMFHTMEKLALAVLSEKRGTYLGSHVQISKDFEDDFKNHDAFKEMIGIYREIMEQKDALLYAFEKTVPEDKLDYYHKCIERFKNRVEAYIDQK